MPTQCLSRRFHPLSPYVKPNIEFRENVKIHELYKMPLTLNVNSYDIYLVRIC